MLTRVLSKEIEEKAENELNETLSKREETLKHTEEWLKKQMHINIQRDSLWLLNFIRGCDFNTQKVQNMLEAYSKLKDFVPEIVCNQDPLLPELQNIIKIGSFVPFGTPDIDCLIFRCSTVNATKTNFSNFLKVGLMMYEIILNESDTVMIAGQCVIVDCQDVGFANLKHYNPTIINKLVNYIFTSVPMRVKHFYFINCSKLLQTLYRFFKPFFPNYIQKLVRFYGTDYSDIYTDVSQHFFPKEYGGDHSCVDDLIVEWKTKLESYRDWFLKNENFERN